MTGEDPDQRGGAPWILHQAGRRLYPVDRRPIMIVEGQKAKERILRRRTQKMKATPNCVPALGAPAGEGEGGLLRGLFPSFREALAILRPDGGSGLHDEDPSVCEGKFHEPVAAFGTHSPAPPCYASFPDPWREAG